MREMIALVARVARSNMRRRGRPARQWFVSPSRFAVVEEQLTRFVRDRYGRDAPLYGQNGGLMVLGLEVFAKTVKP